MKTSRIGIFTAAILIAGAGAGFGIAQAERTHAIGEFMEWQNVEQAAGDRSDNPEWTLRDQEEVEQYNDFAVGPSSGPIETGVVPVSITEDPWMIE